MQVLLMNVHKVTVGDQAGSVKTIECHSATIRVEHDTATIMLWRCFDAPSPVMTIEPQLLATVTVQDAIVTDAIAGDGRLWRVDSLLQRGWMTIAPPADEAIWVDWRGGQSAAVSRKHDLHWPLLINRMILNNTGPDVPLSIRSMRQHVVKALDDAFHKAGRAVLAEMEGAL